jgi:Asp-tRNA(Asn)/Glu-tRNA(Gln) amidotransferase A subunit family amidase
MVAWSCDRILFQAWDAVEIRDRTRKKDVAAHEILEAAIARADEARHLGAVFTPTYDRARTRVGSFDAEAPLACVPTFIKDLAQIRGVPTTLGLARRR